MTKAYKAKSLDSPAFHLSSFTSIRGGKGIRTPDLLIANETLYQLSYTPNIEYSNPWLGTLKPRQVGNGRS